MEVKASDDYEDELEAKMAKMMNRNAHTKTLDAGAKAKGHCAGCNKTITEDDHWVTALNNKNFHRQASKREKLVGCVSCLFAVFQMQVVQSSSQWQGRKVF